MKQGWGADLPVDGLGREFVGVGGLDCVHPAGDLELSLTLQEGRVGIDELLGLRSIGLVSSWSLMLVCPRCSLSPVASVDIVFSWRPYPSSSFFRTEGCGTSVHSRRHREHQRRLA